MHLPGCIQPSLQEKREDTIKQTIRAFVANDSVKLYALIDTSLVFAIQDKREFIKKRNHLYEVLPKNIEINSNDFTIEKELNNTINYSIELPVQDHTFDKAKFTFSFINNEYRIATYLEVLWHPIISVEGNLLESPKKESSK
jgi:hypothetical protein